MNPDIRRRQLLDIGRKLIEILDDNPNREGLVDTPRRWALMWENFVDYDPGVLDVTFESIETDQLVIVKKIPAWSFCEHHILPFSVEVAVGYIARDRVLGLSKIPRIVQKYAHHLQLQERLCSQIADEVEALTNSPDVAVLAIGEHLCMQMRGVKSEGQMVTSVMRGCFLQEPSARQEFLSLIGAL